MMKKLIYILSLAVFAAACVNGPLEDVQPKYQAGTHKVAIDLTVQVNDPSVATKSLGQRPKLRNLMVAVFDESGYLIEYTFATEIETGGTILATQNANSYAYKAYVTQSDAPRIIHFIGNAPEKLTFGVEETVLADISSSIGEYEDDGIYWCRREVPKISGTNSGGIELLAEGDETPAPGTPIYQADTQTRAYFSNVGLIRNFSQIQLISSSADFTLEKYYVVGTPKEGLAAAYNYNSGKFVNYYKDATITGDEDAGYTYNLGDAKTYAEIIGEGYDANVLPTATRYTLAESATESNWITDGTSAYVYECEKPLKAEDAVYIIAYGKYSDGEYYYYKIDLRNADGYFPIIRNFKYTIDINKVMRAGYETIAEAAASTGSGDISTSLETKSLAYISDGVASLEVEYIEKYIVTPGDVTLKYTFLDNVNNNHAGDYTKVWIVVNEAGATGTAIASINGNSSYTVGQRINVSQNPGTITIEPTALTDVPKSQTLTIYAEYTHDGTTHILQRTVNFIVQSKRTMVVSLSPSEVPEDAGSEFDVKISLPAGLSKSIFPLEFLIESGALSINPHNDQMPVRSGFSLVDNTKSSFYFVKTFEYDDYNPESGAVNVVDCHFKTIKTAGKTHIYAANPYFETVYDYQGTVSNLDDELSVYLDTFKAEKFSGLYLTDPVGVGENLAVNATFNMTDIPEDGIVYVSLGNLMPAATETQLEYDHLDGDKVVYKFEPKTTSGTFQLQTAHFDGELYMGLSAYKFKSESVKAQRTLYEFSGSFDPSYLTPGSLATTVTYTFHVPWHYDGIVIEVEMKGLDIDNRVEKLPDNWDNWRDLGNGIYGVRYTPDPANYLNEVSINLIPTILNNEVATITLQAPGYRTLTSKISAQITIPAGNLVVPNDDYTYYIYKSNPDTTNNVTAIASFNDFDSTTQSNGYWNETIYFNGSEIQLAGVKPDDTLYIRYSYSQYGTTRYYVASFKLSDAVNAQVTLNFTRVYN